MAHIIVVGNEKGGSGKSTTCMHLATALARLGQRVGALDLDLRQRSFARYLENRRAYLAQAGLSLPSPEFHDLAEGDGDARLAQAVETLDATSDYIVIDCPGSHTRLSQLAHTMADTLITPLNDSFLDFDVLADIDSETFEPTGMSHYAELVREARRQRRRVDGRVIDWVVMRNRLSMPGDRSGELVGDGLNDLAGRLGFRIIDGFAERAAYRELFPRGLTALDDADGLAPGLQPPEAQATARAELQNLLAGLMLPLNERGRKRAAARAEWFMSAGEPLDVDDMLADECCSAPTSPAEPQT